MRPLTYYLTVLTVVVSDQISKWAVMGNVPPEGTPVLYPFLSLTPTHNTGGAFSLLQAHNSVFIGIACIAALALGYAFHCHYRRDACMSSALALALGGALGNLIDRILYGHVRDFFHLHTAARETLWPIFNIANSAITVAIVLLVARTVWPGHAPDQAAKSA